MPVSSERAETMSFFIHNFTFKSNTVLSHSCCCSVSQSYLTLCDPRDCSMPGSLVLDHLPEFDQTCVCWFGDVIQPFRPLYPLLLLLSVFPSIRIFSNRLALHIRWPKYWSFSYSISPSNEYLALISFRTDWLDLLSVQGALKSTTIQKHSFIGVQPSSWSNSHIHTWLLEKPQVWLYGPLLAK